MTYYRDLSSYEYTAGEIWEGRETVNVGWLDGAQPYPTGELPPEFVARLFEFCGAENTVRLMRGVHMCNLPDCPGVEQPVVIGGVKIYQGSSEVRVIGPERVYAAPTLIYHYVVDHGYRPPDEFVNAVMEGPAPGSAEHRALRRALGERDPEEGV